MVYVYESGAWILKTIVDDYTIDEDKANLTFGTAPAAPGGSDPVKNIKIKMSKNIVTEAKAFDSQILDRIKNGHIPDLRQSKRNEWFYNNVWRDPEYLKMTVGKDLEIFLKYLKPESNILEGACG